MGGGRRVCAAVTIVAAFSICSVWVSLPAHAGEDDPHVMLFSNRDVWRNGGFLSGGIIWGPTGFDRNGLLLKALFSGGGYRYWANNLNSHVFGVETLAQVAPGWLIKHGTFEAKIFFGPEIQNHWLWPNDPDNRLHGYSLGLRASPELWWEPTSTTMVAAAAARSSSGANYSARAAFGWRVLDQFYAGPETQVYGGDGYAQMRFGAHITSLKTGMTEWSAAIGWAIDSDRQSSPYLRLSLMRKQ
jgi:hypothetical protein